jgi:hypothetical protein
VSGTELSPWRQLRAGEAADIHIYSFENIRVIAFPVGSHESGKPDGGSVNTCDNECQENSS